MTFQSHTKGRQGMVTITNRVERNAAHVRCIASLMGVCLLGFIERLLLQVEEQSTEVLHRAVVA